MQNNIFLAAYHLCGLLWDYLVTKLQNLKRTSYGIYHVDNILKKNGRKMSKMTNMNMG
jgi:hypothetical protein